MSQHLKHVDRPLAERVAQTLEELVRDIRSDIAKDPKKLRQTREAALADNMAMLGAYRFALGHSPAGVLNALRESAEHSLEVFQRRGSDAAFPVVNMAKNDAQSEDPDFSLTNPRRGLEAMARAAATGHVLLARRIAQLVGHASDTSSIGEHSDICTPDDQHLAYSLKYYLLGDAERAVEELRDVSASRARDGGILKALAGRERESLLTVVRKALDAHEKEAARPKNRKDPAFFIALLPLAIVSLAKLDGVVDLGGLAMLDSPHLSLGLLRAATEDVHKA